MAGFRATGNNGCFTDTYIQPGDTLMLGESVTTIVGGAGGTYLAYQLSSGIINRSGPAANYTDTFDTAANVYTALSAGNDAGAPVVQPGSTFRVRIINTTAYVETVAVGAGMVQGSGTFTLAANTWRDFLFTVVNPTLPQTAVGTVTASSVNVTFALQGSSLALPVGPSSYGLDIMPGCAVIGTGIAVGTTVASLTMGQGGIVGCTLSGTATASGTVGLSFGPVIRVDSLGAGAQ